MGNTLTLKRLNHNMAMMSLTQTLKVLMRFQMLAVIRVNPTIGTKNKGSLHQARILYHLLQPWQATDPRLVLPTAGVLHGNGSLVLYCRCWLWLECGSPSTQ